MGTMGRSHGGVLEGNFPFLLWLSIETAAPSTKYVVFAGAIQMEQLVSR
jgi:hypothetical protein